MFEGNEKFVGSTLHETRQRLGLSHKKLSELSGVDVGTIRNMEYGRSFDEDAYGRIVRVFRQVEKHGET